MTPSPTTPPVVKAKLLELFKAAVESSTEVWSPKPNEDHQLAENIYIGGLAGRRTFKTFPVGLPLSREETYTVTVEVEVYREGTDGEGTEARMWEIAQQAELAVAVNPTLPGVVGWEIASDFRQTTTPGTDGYLANYTFGVTVTARI